MKPKIIISAGGTGGHIFPALAIAKQLSNDYQIIWVGAKVGLENKLVPEHGYKLETVTVSGVRNKGLLRKLSLPFSMVRSAIECLFICIKHRPKIIIGFGGYATFPICVMGKLLAKPVVIHEQNSIAGLTNKVVAKFANVVLTAFPNVLKSKKTFLVGNPVRDEVISSYDWRIAQPNISSKLRVLIVGGSLGAKVLNDTVPQALGLIQDQIAQVTHQVGRSSPDEVITSYKNAGINANVVTFIDNMGQAYANADLIICRAGASTVAEVASAGIAAIFVPYPYAVDDHQTTNAKYLVESDAALLIPQIKLDVDYLANEIKKLTVDKCQQMGQFAHGLAINNSSELICTQVKQIIK